MIGVYRTDQLKRFVQTKILKFDFLENEKSL